MDLLSINDSSAPSLSTHAPHFSSSSRIPLSKLSTSLNTHVHVEGTWKRLTRTGLGSDVGMAEAMGEKRNAGCSANQTELPKREEGFHREVQQNIRY